MADIKIVKIKLRRGTNAERKTVILDQGELGYTTDTKRIFVGTGVLSGGIVVGNKVHPILSNTTSLTSTVAEIGDVVNAKNLFYQLTATDYSNINSWAYIGPKLNSQNFSFDGTNQISLNTNSISGSQIYTGTLGGGLEVSSGNLQINYNTTTFSISSGELNIAIAGLDETKINSTTFTTGISGGNGAKVGLLFDPNFLYLDIDGRLSLSSVPVEQFPFTALSAEWFGTGLNYDLPNAQITANVGDVDGDTIIKDITTKIISLNNSVALSGNHELSNIISDTYGRVVQNNNSIFDILTGNSTLNGDNSLSAIFNGNPNQTTQGNIPGLPLTMFEAISSLNGTTSTITLTSAGFIVFNGGSNTRADGKSIGRFAIPIFSLPD